MRKVIGKVVVATAKVQIFKQITTKHHTFRCASRLLLLPQRYKFSSKSQLLLLCLVWIMVVVATAKVQIFKQITTILKLQYTSSCCCCYRKGTNFQANHNPTRCFRQATRLLLLPQRYKFSSKSQRGEALTVCAGSCCCYRKGTNFQANHNKSRSLPDGVLLLLLPQRYKFSSKSQLTSVDPSGEAVVVATAKVQIFKQITTANFTAFVAKSCCCYRKGTNFQANHNSQLHGICCQKVVVATAKVQIFKQITTTERAHHVNLALLLLPQRYKFSSKSQLMLRSMAF